MNLQKIRVTNFTTSHNETFLTADYYNLTFIVPSTTPTRTKIILEFPNTYQDIFSTHAPEDCHISSPATGMIYTQCSALANRIFVTSDVSNTFSFTKNIAYTLSILVS